MIDLAGKTIDERYQVIGLLGQGGVGTAWRARDTTLNRDVAIKVMHERYANRPDFQARFLQEARVVAQLEHPGIVKVHDFKQNSALYLIMQLVEGNNLRQEMRTWRQNTRWPSLFDSLGLIIQLCESLAYAHSQGVIHGDLKPENIILRADSLSQPVITDFGLGHLLEGDLVRQEEGDRPTGTPAYASPEQAQSEPLNRPSDIYSLGVILYELAVGQRPFDMSSFAEAISRHARGEPPPRPRSIHAAIPQRLEEIMLKTLEKRPDNRYPTMEALIEDLRGIQPAARDIPPPAHIILDTTTAVDAQPHGGKSDAVTNEGATPPGADKEDVSGTSGEVVSVKPPGLILKQTELAVTPGETVGLQAVISNEDTRVSHFVVQILNIPKQWVGGIPTSIELNPGGQKEITLTISPPRSHQSGAGDFDASFVVIHRQYPDHSKATAPFRTTVLPFYEFNTGFWPQKIREGQSTQVTITNQGNSNQTYLIRGVEQEEAPMLTFEPLQSQVSVNAGHTETVDLKAKPYRRPWFGPPQSLRFVCQIIPPPESAQIQQEHFGEFVNYRHFPLWIFLSLLLFMCLSLTGAIELTSQAQDYFRGRVDSPVVTPVPSDPIAKEPILAEPNFTVFTIAQTIDEGDCVELAWQLENIVTAHLDEKVGRDVKKTYELTSTGIQMKQKCPVETTIYQWRVMKQEGQPEESKSVEIKVRDLETKKVEFSRFPNGLPVLTNPVCILEGAEFEEWGVNFSLYELPTNCKATPPSIAIKEDSRWVNVLTIIPNKDAIEACKCAPLSINLLKATREVTFTYQGSITTTFKVLDQDGVEIEPPDLAINPNPISPTLSSNATINFKSLDKSRDIKQVVFGIGGTPIVISKIEYRFVAKEKAGS